jgi:hypothetical protein
MANYGINNSLAGTQQAVSSSYKSLLTLVSSATVRRIKVYDILIGTNGTPADNYMEWDVSRQTAAATGTSVTPTALDPADGAALSTCLANCTVEGTVTAASSVFYVGVNQRASYRWVAAPGSELVGPAISAAGFAGRVKSGGYTGTATMDILFQEQ